MEDNFVEDDLDIDFILDEVKKISDTKNVPEKKIKEAFNFLDSDEYEKVLEILKKYDYNITSEKNFVMEKKKRIYNKEQIDQIKKLSNEELIKIYRNGNTEVLESLILKNYKYIYYIIRREKLNLKSTLEEEDLVQEGIIGLKKAIEKYKHDEGNFTTYAYFWVNQQIRRAIMDKGFLIRIPVHIQEKLGKIMKLRREYQGEELIGKVCDLYGFTREKAWKYIVILENLYSLISLDRNVGDNNDSILIDFIVGKNPENPEKKVELKELHYKIEDALEKVCKKNKRYKYIMIKRYGLNNNRIHTLEEIGKELNVTRERVRQIQDKIEKRLKKYLKDYRDYSF